MEKHNMPQLRFPEFSGEWEQKKLRDVTKYTKGFAFKSASYSDSGVRIIRVSDLTSNSIKEDNEKVFIEKENAKNYNKYKVLEENIIVTTVGSKPDLIDSAVGRAIYINKPHLGLLNQNLLKFERIENISNRFVLGCISSKRYQQHIKDISRGNANQANITVEDLLNFNLSIPTFPEQKKIASLLSAADKKLEQLQQKKILLQQYKKGMMQKLFSQQIRFKDDEGKEFPKWEEKTIIQITNVIVGGTPSTTKKKYWNGNIGWLSSGDVNKEIITTPSKYITEEGLNNSSAKLMPANTVLLAMTGATLGKVGFLTFECSGNQSIAGFLPNDKFYPTFLYNTLKFNTHKILSLAGGGAQAGINKSSIESLSFNFPLLAEQTKIADFLTAIDDKINVVSAQVDMAKAFKKGLLQQMFV